MDVTEIEPGPDEIERLMKALPGLDIYFIALVWEFAVYCFRLQMGIEDWDSSRKD